MRINLSKIDQEQFRVQYRTLKDKPVVLVTPQFVGTKYTQQNKIFRSSLWTPEGFPISLSIPKFTNWGENPDNFPVPQDLKNVHILEKLDGSALIVSGHKDYGTVIRTRGTVDATQLENGWEIAELKGRYPKAFRPSTDRFTLIYEWLSTTNTIVIKHSELDMVLIAGVWHKDYSLFTQAELDDMALHVLNVPRPDVYSFHTIPEMLETIENIQDKEGVCVYSNNDQTIHKCKSIRYIKLHRFKSGLSLKTVLELYCELGRPQNFLEELSNRFDHECMEMAKDYAERVMAADQKLNYLEENVREILKIVSGKPRKEQAAKILEVCDSSSPLGFSLLDQKSPNYLKLLSNLLADKP